LAHLGDCCEIAWHQGLDLYGYADGLLLKGFEYTAKYNLGEAVPFVETLDRTGKYRHSRIAEQGRGRLRAVFEQIYNHYAKRVGMPAPFTQRAAEKIRPEGAGTPSADHVGFGTLLFTQVASGAEAKVAPIPAPPGGMIGKASGKEIKLTWIAAVGAKHYTVKRAAGEADYQMIAKNIAATSYTDTATEADKVYRYVVSASNPAGDSADSHPISIAAGLPAGWEQQDVGHVAIKGSTNYDGTRFTMEGAGTEIGGASDQGHFASYALEGDGSIIVRFVPQTSSQFSKFGLTWRDGCNPEAANVSLLVGFEPGLADEQRAWKVSLTTRASAATDSTVQHVGDKLPEPAVIHGRLTGFLWLKLERAGDTYTGSVSLDGTSWTPAGIAKASVPRNGLAGLLVCSRLAGVTTTVMFDHVAITPIGESRKNP
jgi:hypothetical protein